jgi:predicted heme/steroid binding protein
MEEKRKISAEELQKSRGASGEKTYVALDGKVYDLSDSPLWEDGEHMGAHEAGHDLTAEFGDAPHGMEVFEPFPVVGDLE